MNTVCMVQIHYNNQVMTPPPTSNSGKNISFSVTKMNRPHQDPERDHAERAFFAILLLSKVWALSDLHSCYLCKISILLSEDSYCCCSPGLVPVL